MVLHNTSSFQTLTLIATDLESDSSRGSSWFPRRKVRRSSTSVVTAATEKMSTVTVGPAKWLRHLRVRAFCLHPKSCESCCLTLLVHDVS